MQRGLRSRASGGGKFRIVEEAAAAQMRLRERPAGGHPPRFAPHALGQTFSRVSGCHGWVTGNSRPHLRSSCSVWLSICFETFLTCCASRIVHQTSHPSNLVFFKPRIHQSLHASNLASIKTCMYQTSHPSNHSHIELRIQLLVCGLLPVDDKDADIVQLT